MKFRDPKSILLAAAGCSAFLGLFPESSVALFNSSQKGTTAAPFLTFGAGARATALGDAYTAVADDANSLYWNPGALTQVPGGDLSFTHTYYLESSYYDYAGYAQNLGKAGAFGIGGQFFSAGSITQTDITGADIGSFSPKDEAFTAGYAYRWLWGSLGLSGKFIRSTILGSAETTAADIGYLSPGFWKDRLKLGAAVTNLGGRLRFDQEANPLPRALRAGAALRLRSFLVSLDSVFPNDNKAYAGLGAEYSIPIADKAALALRAGYNTLTTGDVSGTTGVSLGTGIGFRNLSFDYAFVPLGTLGLTQRASLSYRWGNTSSQTGLIKG